MKSRKIGKLFEELHYINDQYQAKPSIICLFETWLSIDQPFKQLNWTDCKLINSGNFDKRNGFARYFHRNISFEINEDA